MKKIMKSVTLNLDIYDLNVVMNALNQYKYKDEEYYTIKKLKINIKELINSKYKHVGGKEL